MKTYFLCLFASAILSGVICMVAEGSGFEKHIRYACSLICIAVTVTPIMKISFETVELPDVPVVSYDAVNTVCDLAEEKANEYISSLLSKKFGISCKGVCIDLYSNEEGMTVNSVCVYIENGDANGVKEYLEEVLGGNIEVINE